MSGGMGLAEVGEYVIPPIQPHPVLPVTMSPADTEARQKLYQHIKKLEGPGKKKAAGTCPKSLATLAHMKKGQGPASGRVPAWLSSQTKKARDKAAPPTGWRLKLEMGKAPEAEKPKLPPEPEPELPYGAGLRMRALTDKRSAKAYAIWHSRTEAVGMKSPEKERPPEHISRVVSALALKHYVVGFQGLDAEYWQGKGGHEWTRPETPPQKGPDPWKQLGHPYDYDKRPYTTEEILKSRRSTSPAHNVPRVGLSKGDAGSYPKGEGGMLREAYIYREGKHPIPRRNRDRVPDEWTPWRSQKERNVLRKMGWGDIDTLVPGRGEWWATLRPGF